MKTSIRKILFSCFKRNLVKEIKVAQLAGYVSEHSGYHHGEASLQGAIIGMAQNYVGSNNINMLMPNGQFGTRLTGGKDSASPRYIFTELNTPIIFSLFNKQDLPILNYNNDDGDSVEPEYYLPVIPMILVNGVIGIGTGFSSLIPAYNPQDLINIYTALLSEKDEAHFAKLLKYTNKIKPYYRGFKGKIEKNTLSKYESIGVYKRMSSTKIEITELPVGTWTQNYKEFLEDYLDKQEKPKQIGNNKISHKQIPKILI